MPGRVLVTGISGFIGSHVALALLRAGYEVRGSLRNLNRAAEVRDGLARAGGAVDRLEFVELDLLDDRGWETAARGCRYLQHVASPLVIRMPKNRDELIRPAVEGTRRAIGAALAAGVERLVVTSSAAAIAYGHPHDRTEPFTDADWSTTHNVGAYTESKTRAELEAWSLAEEAGRRGDLAAVNPTVVLGPLLTADPGVSAALVRRLLEGSVPFAPRLSFAIVDVRDVAALQVALLNSPMAGGHRFLASAGSMTIMELAAALRPAFPAFASRPPRFEVPDWVVRGYALVDPEARASLGGLGRHRVFVAAPAEAILGRPFMTPRLSVTAMAQSLIDRGLVTPPGGQKRG